MRFSPDRVILDAKTFEVHTVRENLKLSFRDRRINLLVRLGRGNFPDEKTR